MIANARAICLSVVLALAIAGCGAPKSVQRTPPAVRPLADGAQIGAGGPTAGTATAGVRTLLAMVCNDGQLVLRTNREGIVAQMDCGKAVPDATLQRFLGQPVTITYKDQHLKVSNPQAGIIDVAASGATIEEINATP